MNLREHGVRLRELLAAHAAVQQSALAALGVDARPDEVFRVLEATSELDCGGLRLTVRHIRGIDLCPVLGCACGEIVSPCEFSNVRFTLATAVSGATFRGAGILWHLLAAHGITGLATPEEDLLVGLLADEAPLAA